MTKEKKQETTGLRPIKKTINEVVSKKTLLSELKKDDKNFVMDYCRTGDAVTSAMTAYSMEFPAASVKASIMLRDPAVLQIIDKELLANIPKTADDTALAVWKLYRECIDKGHRIKAIELYAKLKGHLTAETINNNYQSWNILIKQGTIAKERETPVITEVVPE